MDCSVDCQKYLYQYIYRHWQCLWNILLDHSNRLCTSSRLVFCSFPYLVLWMASQFIWYLDMKYESFKFAIMIVEHTWIACTNLFIQVLVVICVRWKMVHVVQMNWWHDWTNEECETNKRQQSLSNQTLITQFDFLEYK